MNSLSKIGKNRTGKILKHCLASTIKLRKSGECATSRWEIARNGRASATISQDEFDVFSREGLFEESVKGWQISSAGKMHLRRLLSEVDWFQSQHRLEGSKTIVQNGQRHKSQINAAESPLARLRFRKGIDGKTYINEMCFQAGERLRADYSKGQLMLSVTSNWRSQANGGGAPTRANTIGELTDAAMAARLRTQKALVAAGPEFSGPLVDICCFLKGLELVERERQWPPRSAKLMLKTGLSILARHYGLEARGKENSATRHWGGESFRPSMFVNS